MAILSRFSLLAAVLLAASVTACTTIKELPAVDPEAELDAEAAEERECSRKLLEAFMKDDASAFIALLRPELQEEFRKDKTAFSRFRKIILEERGEPVSFCYVTSLESVVLTPHIWKVRFRHKNKQDQEFYREALFRVIVGRLGAEESANPNAPKTETDPSAGDDALLVFGFNFL